VEKIEFLNGTLKKINGTLKNNIKRRTRNSYRNKALLTACSSNKKFSK
jgi:hypothetical protein